MTKARYELLASKTDEGAKELCDFIVCELGKSEQAVAKIANGMGNDLEKRDSAYWRAMALRHAQSYVEDWKEGI
jgi:hypothetical protein